MLQALGWAHQTHRVKATTTSLNTFFTKTPGLSKPGAVDVMVVDVEVRGAVGGAAPLQLCRRRCRVLRSSST